MSNAQLQNTDLIYAYSAAPRLQFHRLHHNAFARFSRSLSSLEKLLGEEANEEYWARILSWLKRYRFTMIASPLPFNWQNRGAKISSVQIEESIRRCKFLFPAQAAATDEVYSLWKNLGSLNDNPYMDVLQQLWPQGRIGDTLFVVKETRLVAPVAELAAKTWGHSFTETNVLSVSQLDDSRIADSIVLFGPSRWFPAHLFTAPRAYRIHVLNYAWLGDRLELEPAFPSTTIAPWQPVWEESKIAGHPALAEGELSASTAVPDLPDEDLLPTINWLSLSSRLLYGDDDDDEYRESVEAFLLLLAGDMAVFVDASESATTLIIDLDDDDDAGFDENERSRDAGRVGRLRSNRLQPGHYVLLRTEGSGDYVVPIANRLMGTELAAKARESQLNWKHELRRRVNRKGLLESCIELIDLGSARANETNLRNWMSIRSIRPDDIADFRAIMRFIGRNRDFETAHDYSEKIMSAHRRAGQLIRSQLLSEVRKSDLRKLRHDGIMEFSLPDADGGSLTAFRIESVAPEKFEVTATRLDHLISLEEILWLE